MAFDYKVYKSQRIVPVRFKRSVTGQPVLGKPDIDDRGFYRAAITAGNDHGHVVGVTEGNESEITLERFRIDNKADLFVTSSDTAKMTVIDSGGTDQLAASKEPKVKVKGVLGGAAANPETAKVEVRFGSATGPIIGEISVWVFKPLTVSLTPHNVTIKGASTAGIASSANIASVIDLVKAFWEPCGVKFQVEAIQNDPVTFATAGKVVWKPEVNTLLSTNRTNDSINAYFVNEVEMPGLPGVLGLGISRARVNSDTGSANPYPHPGIILGDKTVGLDRHTDLHFLANDLAHEIGHFFTLAHIDFRNSGSSRDDTFAARMLMHPNNTRTLSSWRNDAGYGARYRGGMITMKDLVGFTTDGEAIQARGVIGGAGPY